MALVASLENKMRRILGRLLILMALMPLLAGCGVRRDDIEALLIDIVGGPPPNIATPSTPALAPTPTLATDVLQGEESPQEVLTPVQETRELPGDAPEEGRPGPFTGRFVGDILGDNDSSASLELVLVQEGRQIEGTATLGEGLIVSAGGVCGSFPIPAVMLSASDVLEEASGRHISTTTNVEVSGFEVPVELEATLAPDGETVTAEATIHPPALCRTSPTMTATLLRVDGDG